MHDVKQVIQVAQEPRPDIGDFFDGVAAVREEIDRLNQRIKVLEANWEFDRNMIVWSKAEIDRLRAALSGVRTQLLIERAGGYSAVDVVAAIDAVIGDQAGESES